MNDGNDDFACEGDDALWSLLARARKPAVSPYFARRVLRDVAREPQGPAGAWWARVIAWLAMPRVAWSAAAMFALLSVTGMLRPVGETARYTRAHSTRVRIAAQKQAAETAALDDVNPQDLNVIADLDNQLAYEENNVWLDDAAH